MLKLKTYAELKRRVSRTLERGIARVKRASNRIMVKAYWQVGRDIQAHILEHQERADYGRRVIERLASDLGISRTTLYYAYEFARTYPIVQRAGQLGWRHYQALLSVNDRTLREKFQKQAIQKKWTARELREAIKTQRRGKTAGKEKLTPRRGNLNHYRLVARDESNKSDLDLDLGFSTYLAWPGRKSSTIKAGTIVKTGNVTAGIRLCQPGTRREVSCSIQSGATIKDLFTYRADVYRVIDGDTVWARIDLGFGIRTRQKLRLRGIDAPEINTKKGVKAKKFLQKMIRQAKSVIITTSKSDKYDRYLTDLYCGTLLANQSLLDHHHALRL
ncbi:DUF1016 N-terminal domain-containing protein [Omnitrophica bacterium]|nr:DUF1016 N-terminal domain-containing protein [Candidatus Omnitrophota bacterium]